LAIALDSRRVESFLDMNADTFFNEIHAQLRALQLVVGTLLLTAAIYSGMVVLGVGIYPLHLAITTVFGTGMVVLLVAPLLVARAILPTQITHTGMIGIIGGRWNPKVRPGCHTDRFIQRTGDVARLWYLFTTQTLVGAGLVAAAALTSLTLYVIAPSAPPLALGTILVVAISSHFPTKPIVARWMAIHLRALDASQ
jgi:hypothetical protein